MFDDRESGVECYPSLVERSLASLLDEPLTPFLLADGFSPHGQPSALPGIEVPDSFARILEEGASRLAAAKEAYVAQNQAAAVQARELAAFAALRPAELLDRPDDEVGSAAAATRAARPAALTSVSEWAVDEVMATLGVPSRTAGLLLAESVTLVERLPATLSALQAGTISWSHVRAMIDWVADLDDAIRPGVEAALIANAPGRTAAQLRAAARRAALRADAAAAARRLARALRERSVRMHGDRDGMAALTAMMSAPVTRACYRALEEMAEACTTPGDTRTKDQRMTDCLADCLLGRGSADRPPVQVTLTVVASAGTLLGGDEPGEVDGEPVSALQIRELAYALGLLPRPAADLAPDDPGETSTVAASDEPTETVSTRSADPREQAVADLAALMTLRTTTGTGLASLPTLAIVDEISGELRALTDGFTVRRIATCSRRACRSGRRPCTHAPAGSGLGPPPPTKGYEPSAPLDRFVRARDRRCLFPGCRARPMRCDLDHVRPWPTGPTSAANLCCLCRHHHRLSHQAPGWKLRRLPDGGLEWTLPGGERLVTRPIPFGTDDLPPPAVPATPAAATAATPPPGPAAEDDPPPF